MEWLSHSQKKYCELCKTPFRFTKLYDPNMPQELPMPLFLKELAIHCGKHVATWLRFLLVLFVWLGWLPWSMRAIWRGLFWLADGRWPSPPEVPLQNATAVANETLSSLAAFGTSPATSTLASSLQSAPPSVDSISAAIPQLLSPVSSMLNFSAGEPLLYTVAKTLFASSFGPPATPQDTGTGNTTITAIQRLRHPSWLSDIQFLNTLTPYPTVNNIIIDTLEGQLITLLLVISFILVFLIREWVVQQQPVLNIAEGEREAAIQLMADDAADRHNDQPQRPVREQNNRREPARQPEQAPEPGPLEDNEEHGDNGRPATNFGPLPSTEFNVPDFGTPRPTYPSDRAQRNPWEAEGAERVEGATNTGENGASVERESGRRRFSNAVTPGNVWAGPGDTSFAWDNRQENGNPFSRSSAAESEDTTSKDKQKQGDDEGADPDVATLPAHHTASIFRSDSSGGPSSSSRNLARSFEVDEPTFGSRAEPTPDAWNDDFPSEWDDVVNQDPAPTAGEVADSEGLEAFPSFPDTEPEDDTAIPESPPNPPLETEENLEVPQAAQHHLRLSERVANWFWGDIPARVEAEDDSDDEHVVENPAEEAPFVPVRHHDGNIDIARDGLPEGGADINDADAVDDADDLEGILELVGMQGPIFGLLQNGVFCGLLIFVTIFVGIWLPYVGGKFALVLLTNPIRFFLGVPLKLASIVADVAADTFICTFAYAVFVGNTLLRTMLSQIGIFFPALRNFTGENAVTVASLSLMQGSGNRLKRVLFSFLTYNDSDLPFFSVHSHVALKVHEARIGAVVSFVYLILKTVLYDFPVQILTSEHRLSVLLRPFTEAPAALMVLIQGVIHVTRDIPSLVVRNVSWSHPGTLTDVNGIDPLDSELARWDTKDRVIAIIVGYGFVTFLGLAYLRISAWLNGPSRHERVNDAVADALQQAGGVMKVILIIGIEMIVFPLYCGILLDVALLPLFETVTVTSRLNFTLESPLTSLFVHWFVGTCYMFHFALFVAMCRKILRTGVLCKFHICISCYTCSLSPDFIRDPDDPTFHPVRDVLERSIATQLRKIGFSALVYGALVLICLGGVVWGLHFAAKGVLPLHWSSNEPVLEFPVDLLFYSFVVPLAIRSIKPSDSIHVMYDWWFQKCARMLRLTSFLFGEREPDEEGHYANRPWYSAVASRLRSAPLSEQRVTELPDEQTEKETGFIRDGKFVRAPASDQVRIPKGVTVFVEVNRNNERLDGKPDRDDGLHGRTNEMFTQVYIPPSFRARVAAFILLLWLFAAMTGISATIFPLLLGRRMISSLFPANIRVNDIYAFSVGTCVLGALFYAAAYFRRAFVTMREQTRPHSQSPMRVFTQTLKAACYAFRLVYAYSTLVIFLPSVFALLSELYLLIPLHTYFYNDKPHVIYFIQDWTLGVLYVRMALKVISWYPESRLAMALDAVIRDGWLNPDMKLATRAFIIPASIAALLALIGPLPAAYILNTTAFRNSTPTVQAMMYRYSYPMFLSQLVVVFLLRRLRRQIVVWRANIRDDVYLIGERLHNFRERRKDVGSVRRRVITS